MAKKIAPKTREPALGLNDKQPSLVCFKVRVVKVAFPLAAGVRATVTSRPRSWTVIGSMAVSNAKKGAAHEVSGLCLAAYFVRGSLPARPLGHE
jgi:hypothetical protein